jgi:hypothetical protein
MGGNNIVLVEIKVAIHIHDACLLFCLLFIRFMDFESLWLLAGNMVYEKKLWLAKEFQLQGCNFKQF